MHIHAVVGDPARCLGSSMRQRAEDQKKLDDPNEKRMWDEAIQEVETTMKKEDSRSWPSTCVKDRPINDLVGNDKWTLDEYPGEVKHPFDWTKDG